MRQNNIYIDASNVLAISHFRDRGCDFIPGTREYYECCSSCGRPYAKRDVLYVTGGFVEGMSGTQFHNYLQENNLLMTQQVEV